MSKRCWILVLGLIGLGCGTHASKPLHSFPSREELSELARAEQPRGPAASPELSPEQWALALPVLPSPNPGLPLLAQAAPRAAHTPALDCVAHEIARFVLEFPGHVPSRRLRQFVAARCGSPIPMPHMQSWNSDRKLDADDAAMVAALQQKLAGPIAPQARNAGFAIARAEGQLAMVVVWGDPKIELEPVERVVGAENAIELRGRVLFETDGVSGYVNAGAYGVRGCTNDPGVAAPRFALRCELASDDDAAWIQLTAAPRGRVLGSVVHALLALRNDEAARVYLPRRSEDAGAEASSPPATVPNGSATREAVFAQVNRVRQEAGLRPLVLAAEQSATANSVASALFAAFDSEDEAAQQNADGIVLGLMAGWDVRGGIIRGANVVALSDDTLDAVRWTLDALEQPIGRSNLLDPDARVLALGSLAAGKPTRLSAVALTYGFFDPEPKPNAWARKLLERLARVRKARGLGRTRFVPDAPGMQEQLAAIHRNEVEPFDGLRNAMIQTSEHLRMGVQGFVWETHDFETLEFPPELLQKRDLTLGAGVTYHRAPGGAWGQYTVLFVVIDNPHPEA